MDLDKEFVRSVLRDGKEAFVFCMDRGLDPEKHLHGDGKVAWKYVGDHWKEYGEVPSWEVVVQKTGCDLAATSNETYKFFFDEVIKRRTAHLCAEVRQDIQEHLSVRDPTGAAEAITEIHRKIQDEQLSVKKVESLLSLGREVMQAYDDAKAGVRGIGTPWPTMNDQTLGWWPEDLVLIVGRMGVGKTWSALLILHEVWKQGKKVLLISTEMNKIRLAQRFFALSLRMPYHAIRRGRLGEFVEGEFYRGVEELLNEGGLDIISGDYDYTIENVAAVVESNRPDVLGVDGPYLIKNKGKDRHERVSNTFDDFKRIGRKYQIAVITNLQFNRSAKTGQAGTIANENIGITDVAAWNADVSYGLFQTDDMFRDWEMGLKAMKIREGKPSEFKIRWDHKNMDFSEITVEGEGQSGDHRDLPAPGHDSGESKDDFEDMPF